MFWNGSFGSRGSVLILSLWVTAFLSVLLFLLGQQVVMERRAALAYTIRIYESLARETLQARLAAALSQDNTPEYDSFKDSWSRHDEFFAEATLSDRGDYKARSGAGVLNGAVDEERFVNLNEANFNLLNQHFKSQAGLDDKEAEHLASAVQDWRDLDNFATRPEWNTEGGAFSDSPCKNAPFESLEELRLVEGMDEKIYQAVSAVSTVYGKGKVNLNTAPPAALKSLGAPDSLVEKILRVRAGSDRVEGTDDDGFFENVGAVEPKLQAQGADLSTEELNALNRMKSEGWVGVESDFFRLPIHVTGHGRTRTRYLVMDRQGKVFEVRR